MKRAVMLLLLVTSAAHAAPPTPGAEAEAKRLYQEGTKAFRLLEYPEAIKDYKAAFKLVPRPFFLYNIAQAYRLSGDAHNAVAFYQSFLNTLPDAPNRPEVEQEISELQAQLSRESLSEPKKIPPPTQVTLPPTAPDLPPTADHGSRPIYKKWWFWAGLGTVAAGAVAVVALSGSKGNAPSTDLGTMKVFP